MTASRRAILVLGMHRSGTSALTRVLNLRGATLPDVVLPANAANVAGYWEPAAIVSLHDRLLGEAGSAWDDPTEFPAAWFESERGRQYADELASTIATEFGDAALLVVKDPRACRLIPLWTRSLARLNILPAAVLVVRHPLEVAASLQARDGVPETHSLLMWLEHVLAAEAGSRSMPRVVITYEQLLTDWLRCCQGVESALGLTLPPRSAEADAAISQFLEPSLRHASLTAEALNRAGVPDWVPRVYRCVQAASVGEPLDVSELDGVRDQMRRASVVHETSVRWLANRAWTKAQRVFALEQHVQAVELEHAQAVQTLEMRQQRIQELEQRVRELEQRVRELEVGLASEQARSADVQRQADEARQSRDVFRARLEALEATWLVRMRKKLSGRQ